MSGKYYEILALLLRYWFIFAVGYIFYQALMSTLKSLREGFCHDDSKMGKAVIFLVLFDLTAFGLLSLKENGTSGVETIILGVLTAALFLFQYYLVKYIFIGIDSCLLIVVDTLAIIGFIMLERLDPFLALRQVEWFALGNVVLIISVVSVHLIRPASKFVFVLMTLAVVFLLLPFLFGQEIRGSRNWISIGNYKMQPSEFVKIILIFVLAAELESPKRRRERVRVFIFAVIIILIVVLQRDLGGALFYFCVFTVIYYIATSDLLVTAGAGLMAVASAVISYHLFSHVRVRIEAWKNPWSDVEGKGYQIVQSLIAIASGKLEGSGLGLGRPQVVPVAETDFIFAAICEEFGVIIGILIIGFYAIIMLRGAIISLKAHSSFDALFCIGAAISVALQSFVIIGGVIKMIPLTGFTMPFVSYGGSSMLVSFGLIGIMEGIAAKTYREILKNQEEATDTGMEA